jgi:hypothetical protein
MYPTSAAYDAAIYAPARSVLGRVTFDISDVTAAGDISSIVTSTEQTLISDKAQLADKIRTTTFNISTFETDRFRLDGSFTFSDDTSNVGQLGYVSQQISQSDGTFTTPISIVFNFNTKHSSAGITITFDPFSAEYAEEFEVIAYDGASVIDSVLIDDNDRVQVEALGQLIDYDKIEIIIYKWGRGDRRARVVEVDFGIVRVYADDSLIRMGLIEEMDAITARVPSPEFNFTIDNSNRDFNILNPSGFFQFLQERQLIFPELGLRVGAGVEWVPMGEYLLFEWISDPGALTASFTARTNLDLMANFDYEQLTGNTQSLKDLAEELFTICGIANFEIDSALDSIMTDSLANKTNCKDALQMVAIAGQSNLYVTRSNTIKLEQITIGTSDDTVDLDSMYAEPQITLIPIVKQVDVTYYTDLDTHVIVTVANGTITAGEVVKLEKNTFINDAATAGNVAAWILARKNLRADWLLNWRGNPAHELGDVVDFENSFGANRTAFLTKNELDYEGYLIGRLEARGSVS